MGAVVIAPDVRRVLGLSAESWAVGAFLVVVITIACQELGRALASLSAVRVKVPIERRSSLPSFREARAARRGVWK